MNLKRSFILFLTSYLFLILPTLSLANNFSFNGLRINKRVKPLREIKHQHIVSQSLDFSCGAAGLSTLLNYYLNEKVKEKDIIAYLLTKVSLEKVQARRGFSLLDLKTYAQDKGYDVTGYKMDMEFLKKLNKPVLVPIKFKNYSHFVIVRGIIADRIFLADPAAGNISLKLDKFQKMWSGGIGLVVEKVNGHPVEYALKVDKDDIYVSDYKTTRRLMDQSLIRTSIFTDEWK